MANALMVGPAHFPSEWDTWRRFLENFDLDVLYPLQTWIPIAQWCVGDGFPFPPDLARATVATLSRTSPIFSPKSQLHILWRSSIIAFSDHSHATTDPLTGASSCAEPFLETLKATDLRPSQAAKWVALSFERLRPTRTLRNMGTAENLKAPREAGTPLSAADTFFCSSSLFIPICAGFASATAPSHPGSGNISASASLKMRAHSRYEKLLSFS